MVAFQTVITIHIRICMDITNYCSESLYGHFHISNCSFHNFTRNPRFNICLMSVICVFVATCSRLDATLYRDQPLMRGWHFTATKTRGKWNLIGAISFPGVLNKEPNKAVWNWTAILFHVKTLCTTQFGGYITALLSVALIHGSLPSFCPYYQWAEEFATKPPTKVIAKSYYTLWICKSTSKSSVAAIHMSHYHCANKPLYPPDNHHASHF